ncbi:MAG: 1,4-alpha-glucan branching protein GlgB [Bacillota bacterium]
MNNGRTGHLTEKEIYLFNRGELYHSYLKFGAHQTKLNGLEGVHFAVWAPNAAKVSVVGDFNSWQGKAHSMERKGESGVWVLFVPGLKEGEMYKYEIHTGEGQVLLKADPFAFYSELRPNTASIVYSLEGYQWKDHQWFKSKKRKPPQEQPLLIYEVHLGSWKRKEDGSFLTYRELAGFLPGYVKGMGFTHIELMPLMEHPFDGSWGYQITGYYSPTSRYGTPQDLMYFIDCCHRAGIGVILDWVPGHFCKDAHGLGRFDGTDLYERDEHEQWGTYKFNFGRTEVWSFLISNAVFWFDKFHVDGLRIDGVSSMLYLDYEKEVGSWQPNIYGGRENLEAVAFMQKLNAVIFSYYPWALMIAEEATDWPLVSWPVDVNGLGCNFKWNMGWMNDTLKYMQLDFPERPAHHRLLTFSLLYAFSENFVLPFSHDEVVHGKKSLINRMPGDYWQKFAGLRALYCYFLCHPGKKLLFMGGEFAQFIEWRYYTELEWFLLAFEMHRKYQDYVKTANLLYWKEKCLWEKECGWEGFEWIDADNAWQSILVFLRWAKDKKDFVLVVLNFRPETYRDFRVGVPVPGMYKEILNTDSQAFGGSGQVNSGKIKAEKINWHQREYSMKIKVPPLGGVLFKPARE